MPAAVPTWIVVRVKGPTMGYWIFKANPDYYRLADRLLDPNPLTTWKVSRYASEIKAGDRAFIWRTGPDRGFVAVMDVDSNPAFMPEIENELPYAIPLEVPMECCRVKGRFTRRFACISASTLKQTPGLENMSVFHGVQRGTNFTVTAEETAILLDLIAKAKDLSNP